MNATLLKTKAGRVVGLCRANVDNQMITETSAIIFPQSGSKAYHWPFMRFIEAGGFGLVIVLDNDGEAPPIWIERPDPDGYTMKPKRQRGFVKSGLGRRLGRPEYWTP